MYVAIAVLFALLGWVPWRNIEETRQPRFVRNASGRFESRWSTIMVNTSPAIMLKGMTAQYLYRRTANLQIR